MWKCGDEQQVPNILPYQHLVDPKHIVIKGIKYCTKKSELAKKKKKKLFF